MSAPRAALRVPSEAETTIVWQIRARLLVANAALAQQPPDIATARIVLAGAVEATQALAWAEGAP